MEHLDSKISLSEMSKKSRAQHMHTEWDEKVFQKISTNVNEKVNSLSTKETNIRNREAYQRYLDTSNEKGMLFRDIIMESEYDPLADAAARNIKTVSNANDDPSRRATQRKKEEDTTMGKLSAEFRVKNMLSPTSWGTGIIEATPFGHFNTDQKERKVNKGQVSTVHVGQFDVANDQTLTEKEFRMNNGRGKRTSFENPYQVDVALVEQKDHQTPIIFNQH